MNTFAIIVAIIRVETARSIALLTSRCRRGAIATAAAATGRCGGSWRRSIHSRIVCVLVFTVAVLFHFSVSGQAGPQVVVKHVRRRSTRRVGLLQRIHRLVNETGELGRRVQRRISAHE